MIMKTEGKNITSRNLLVERGKIECNSHATSLQILAKLKECNLMILIII